MPMVSPGFKYGGILAAASSVAVERLSDMAFAETRVSNADDINCFLFKLIRSLYGSARQEYTQIMILAAYSIFLQQLLCVIRRKED